MKEERREQVKNYIDSKGEVKLAELEELFPDCSTMTLRRDLLFLEEEGLVKRTRGGAIALNRILTAEGLYSQRANENLRGKMEIAKLAAKHLDGIHSLYLDSGSTIMCLARILPDTYRPIITSGANIALELIKHSGFAVTLLGGQLNSNTLSVSGQMAETAIDGLNIETAVMSTSGFDFQNGFTSGTFTENEIKRLVIAKAKNVIMLMDDTKIGRSMPMTFASLDDIDVLITDSKELPALKSACENSNVLLISAAI